MGESEPVIDAKTAEDFVRAYARDQSRILGFVMTLIPSQHDAEEVLQETSLVLWKKWAEYDARREFSTWACGVARLEVFKHLRKKPKLLHLSEEVLQQIADLALTEVEGQGAESDSVDALRECLGELPDNDAKLLTMRYRLEVPVAEIAQEIGLARSTVFDSLRRIRRRLLRCVQRRLASMQGASA